jgi:hypothetical protein
MIVEERILVLHMTHLSDEDEKILVDNKDNAHSIICSEESWENEAYTIPANHYIWVNTIEDITHEFCHFNFTDDFKKIFKFAVDQKYNWIRFDWDEEYATLEQFKLFDKK